MKTLAREEIFNKVAKIISNHFEIDTDKVTDELNIKDDLKADSISIMEQRSLMKTQNKLKQLAAR